ncbi:hypothetical protein C8R45DRAFT_176160 [Mycena sanguinolenta]|nr:hypothetical protein C8R45DRAFT_176160 [Mycena sanguinolenta]
MEGMLIFSGLFSASLTAFLIESYKFLQPNSGDLTVTWIRHLSQQLDAIARNTSFVVPPSSTFAPTTGSFWCNALWFISLSLSLTCALLATLVEQWAREFLHKTEMRPSPLRRARVFSFLYFGLKHFRMHTIVDAIPFLLHASLLLFFAGLVAFLLPVNRIMMYLICIVLFGFMVLYAALTILPVVRLNCPYRTPLSAPLWSMLQAFSDKTDCAEQQTMTEAVAALALQDTKRRDQRALKWTLDSLTDDIELLPFVETIPDIIHGPNGFRRANDVLFESLLGTIEVTSPLVTRIYGLISGTKGMSPKDPLRVRRCTAGYRAIWALCLMPRSWDRLFDLHQTFFLMGLGGLAASINLAVNYQAQRWAHSLLKTLRNLLVDPAGSVHPREEALPTIQRLIQLLLAHQDIIVSPLESFFIPSPPNPRLLLFLQLEAAYEENGDPTLAPANLDKIGRIVAALYDSHDWAYNSLMLVAMFINSGLSDLLTAESEPLFEPLRTCYSILSEIETNPPRRLVTDTWITFPPTIPDLEFSRLTPTLLDTLARIVFRMCPFFSLSACDIHLYLAQRRNTDAIQYALQDCDMTKLARPLAVRLSNSKCENEDSTVLEHITIVASCVDSDSVAIGFIDTAFAGESPNSIPKYPAIRAVRYLRRLKQVNNELIGLSSSSLPQAPLRSRVQEICHQEFFHDISPLFLPPAADIATAVESLQIHLLNKYISFLSDFFETPIPATAKINLSAFNRIFSSSWYSWEEVNREIQDRFFFALLAYNKAFAATQLNLSSDMAAIGRQLWSSDLFWMDFYWQGQTPRIKGIQQSCLHLLHESLKLYNHAGKRVAGDPDVSVDITDSKRLLEEVHRQLFRCAI